MESKGANEMKKTYHTAFNGEATRNSTRRYDWAYRVNNPSNPAYVQYGFASTEEGARRAGRHFLKFNGYTTVDVERTTVID